MQCTDHDAHDQSLLDDIFNKKDAAGNQKDRLWEYMNEMQIMELCKLYWGVLKKKCKSFDDCEDYGERRYNLRELCGPMPTDKEHACAVPGCNNRVWICNPRCMWRNADYELTVPDTSAKGCTGAFLCYTHRGRTCGACEHTAPEVIDVSEHKIARSLDLENRLGRLNKLTKESRSNGKGRIIQFGKKLAVLHSIGTPSISQAKRTLELDSEIS